MAAGTLTISGGAFTLDSTGRTNIAAFVQSIVTSTTSGASVVVFPDANSSQVYVGVLEQLR